MQTFAKYVTKFAKPIVAVWIILFIILAFFALQLPSKLKGDGFTYDGDYQRVTAELSETFGLPANTIFVLFDNKSDEEIERVLTNLKAVEEIDKITSPIGVESLNKDNLSYALLDFDNTVEDYFPIIDDIREITEKEKGISITGAPVISKDTNLASQKDLMTAEAIGVPIALVVLLLAFGTVFSALLPIIVGAITVVTAFGILTLFSGQVNLSIFILNIVPMLGLALSIDFALLFINRYREERERHDVVEAVQISMLTAGRSIIFSALCVMIGLGAMVVIKVEIFENIALGGALVVMLAIISGLTLLPSLIVLLGDRLNKWRLIRVKPTASRWQGFASFVIKNPIKIILAAVILLGIAMIPIKDMELTIPSVDALPTSFDARQTYDKLVEEFDLGKQATVFMLAERDGGWTERDGLEKMYEIQEALQDDPLVVNVTTMFTAANIDSVDT